MSEVINSIIAGLNNVGQWFWDYAAGLFVQSSVLIVLLLLVDFVLRKRVRAVFRYCVWMLVFVKLLLPTSFALPTGIGYWLGDYWSSELSVEKAMPDIEEAVPVVVTPGRMVPAQPEIVALEPPADEIVPVETTATVAGGIFEPAKIRLEPVRWQGLVFLSWLVGVLVFSVLLLQRAQFVKRLLAQAKEADRGLLDLLGRCRGDIGVKEKVKLKLSANMVSPAVCGIFEPTILLPVYLVKKLSGKKLRSILIHELAHIKRRDMWVNMVQSVLQIVYFYNPFVWLANAMVRRFREQAVDEMVLVALGKEADGYSNMLIDIGEMAFWRPNLSLRMIGVVESKKALASRIRHIAGRPIPKSAKVGIVGLIAGVIIGAILLPMAKAERTGVGVEVVRENSQAQVKRLIKEAEDYFARLGKAKKRQDWSEVERWAERLRDVFRKFKSAITVNELRARLENLGGLTRRQEKKLRELKSLKQTIEACASDREQLRELRRLIHNLEELSDDLHDAIRDDKMYLVTAIYDELNRQWRGFRAIVRPRRVRVPRAARSERSQSRRWIDILELIDVERDAKGGDWRCEYGTLIGFAQSTLETTYELPCEYDILWEFESNSTAINLLLASPLGKRFEWMMKGWSHRLCGIREVDCKPVNANETTVVFPLKSGVRYVAEVRVRKDRFVALVDGEEILNYKTDWSNIEVCKPWHPFELKGRRLGLWLNKHWTKTYRLKVRPHNGDRGVADNLIVPGTRVGNYAIGISKDDVLKSLGKPNVIFHRGEKYTLDNLPKEYFMVYDDISFGLVDDSVEGVSALSPLYKFANGLGIGDSEQKIKQAFGHNYHFKETEGKDCLTYEDEGIQFEIHKDNRTVMEISVFRKTRQRPAGRRRVAPRKPKGLESGLVAYWKFDEGSGTMTYDSAGKSHGIVQGALWTTGKIDKGLGFDGVDDAVTTAVNVDQSPSSKGVTLCAWVYPTSISAGRHQVISSDNRGYDWSLLRQADKWYVFTGENSRSTGFSVDLFTWQHVTAVFVPGAGVRFYKNGDEFSIPHIACDDSDNNIAVGDNPGPGEEFFAGVIDEVRIYNEALSAEQVKQICGMTARWAKAPADRAPRYAARRAVPVATEMREGLMAHWKFDEGSGTTVYDSVSNNHGTIYGAKWTADGALRFDGKDDYVDLGYAASLKASLPVTLSGWIKRSSSKSATFFALDEQRTTYYGIWLNVDRNQVLEIAFGDGQGGDSPGHRRSKHGNTVLNPHVWYHVAAVIRGPTDMGLYINGQDDGGYYSGSGGSLVYSSGISRIGAGNVYFDGEIDEVMIFDGALSAEEIRRIYKRQRKAKPITRDTGPKLTEGKSGKAYYFDGKGDYISVPDNPALNITGDITISAWVCLAREGGSDDKDHQAIVTKCVDSGAYNNPFDFRTHGVDSHLAFVRAGDSGHECVYSTKGLAVMEWHHVLVRAENKVPEFYVNGIVTGKTADTLFTKTPTGNTKPLLIGRRDDGLYLNGKIDEVALFNRALSDYEIQILYRNSGRLTGSEAGLVGYWSFDADDGDVVVDSSPYHNDGKLEDRPEAYYQRHGWATPPTGGIVATSSDKGPKLTEGIRGKAYYFDGEGDFINIDESESLDISGKEITVSAWIKAGRIDRRQVIAAKTAGGDNTWLVEINPVDFDDGKLNFYLDLRPVGDNFGSKTAITAHTWYHVAFVYDGTQRIIYVNGRVDASEAASGNIPTNNQPVRIGGWGSLSRYFKGSIDEVVLFNRALSGSEIQQLYENPGRLTGNEPGLVGYWNFDADDGDTVINSSPYRNHGKLRSEGRRIHRGVMNTRID